MRKSIFAGMTVNVPEAGEDPSFQTEHIKFVSWCGNVGVTVRPGLIDWNAISRKHTLDQLLEEIGEPVYRYQRKESAQEGFKEELKK